MIVREIHTGSILGKSGMPGIDYSLNPYVGCGHACRYCYAEYMARYSAHTEPWGEFVDVKNWPRLENTGKYGGKKIIIGAVTDPYQAAESEYKRTRRALEELAGSGASLYILTKSDLVLRDLELIKNIPHARVSFSINTLDASFQARMDKAPAIERRVAAMKAFHDAGIKVSCFIAPLFPGITRVEEIIDTVRNCCDEIWIDRLNLRGNRKPLIMAFIARHYPWLFSLYK